MNKWQKIELGGIFALTTLALGVGAFKIPPSGELAGAATVFQVFQGGTGSASYPSNKILKGNGFNPIQASGLTIDASNNLSGIANLTVSSCTGCGGSGSGMVNYGVREGYTGAFNKTVSLSYEGGAFNVNYNPTTKVASVSLDYTKGPASRTIAQTISGKWDFTASPLSLTAVSASVSANFEAVGYASLGRLFVGTTTLSGSTTPQTAGGFSTIASLADPLSGEGNPRNYNLLLSRPVSTNGTGTGLAFGVGTDLGSVGASIIFRRDNSQYPGDLLFFTKNSTVIGANPILRFAITGDSVQDAEMEVGGSIAGGGSYSFGVVDNTERFTFSNGSALGTTNILTLGLSGASVSTGLETVGYASASNYKGSAFNFSGNCSGTSFVQWSTTGLFTCAAAPGASSGITGMEIRAVPGGTKLINRPSISFDNSAFDVIASGTTDAKVSLDYVNGPASRTIAQTISGAWTFSNGATISSNFEVQGYASLSNNLFLNSTRASLSSNFEIGGYASVTMLGINPGGRLTAPLEVYNGILNTSLASFSADNVNTGNAFKFTANKITSGQGFVISGKGLVVTPGCMLCVVNDTANITGAIASISGKGVTTGSVLQLQIAGPGLGGAALKIIDSGTSTGVDLLIRANSATTQTIASISATALTTGSMLQLTTNGPTTGSPIRIVDNADFGAVKTGSELEIVANSSTVASLASFSDTAAMVTPGSMIQFRSGVTTGALASASLTGITTGQIFNLTVPTNGFPQGQILLVKDFAQKMIASLSGSGNFESIGYASHSTYFGPGIPSTNNGNYLCWNTTTFQFEQNVTACLVSSERYKEEIKDSPYGLSEIVKLDSKLFHYKDGYGDNGVTEHVGLIAENVGTIIPTLAVRNTDGTINSYDPIGLTSVLVQAIKDQQVQIDALANRVAALEQGKTNVVGNPPPKSQGLLHTLLQFLRQIFNHGSH